jgi:hypothetical protein
MFVAECTTGILLVFNGEKQIEHLTLKRDEELIKKIVLKGKLFFLIYILPELISKKFSSAKIIKNYKCDPFKFKSVYLFLSRSN